MIQTTEQYQFLYAMMAQYSLQLQHNQDQTQEPEQNPVSTNRLSSQLQNLQLENTHQRHQNLQNPRN